MSNRSTVSAISPHRETILYQTQLLYLSYVVVKFGDMGQKRRKRRNGLCERPVHAVHDVVMWRLLCQFPAAAAAAAAAYYRPSG